MPIREAKIREAKVDECGNASSSSHGLTWKPFLLAIFLIYFMVLTQQKFGELHEKNK
jgi:hypothetical protein